MFCSFSMFRLISLIASVLRGQLFDPFLPWTQHGSLIRTLTHHWSLLGRAHVYNSCEYFQCCFSMFMGLLYNSMNPLILDYIDKSTITALKTLLCSLTPLVPDVNIPDYPLPGTSAYDPYNKRTLIQPEMYHLKLDIALLLLKFQQQNLHSWFKDHCIINPLNKHN